MLITFLLPKGGAGKTSTAINLAPALRIDDYFDLDSNTGATNLARLRDTPPPYSLRTFSTRRELENAIRETKHRRVIADCGGFTSDFAEYVIRQSDLIICPGTDDQLELNALIKFNQLLAQLSAKEKRTIKAHFLLCRVNSRRRNFKALDDLIAQLPHVERFQSIIPHRPGAVANHPYGRGVLELPATASSDAGIDVRNLAAEIETLLASC